MADSNKAIGYLELNSKQWDDALAMAGKALVAFASITGAIKIGKFFEDGTAAAIKFGNEAFFAAQKLNGYDPGKLLIVQKALEGAGLSAADARGKIEEFGMAGRPLDQMFKGGQSGFQEALTRAAKEYGTQASVLSNSAEKFAFVQQQLNNVGTKLEGFFLGLAEKIAQPLSDLLDQIDKIDLVGKGQQFGAYIADAINVVKGLYSNGDLFEAAGLALQVGFELAVDYLMQPSLWAGVVKVAVGALAIVGNFLTTIFLGIGKLLVASIETALERMRDKVEPWLKIISPAYGLASAAGYEPQHFSKDVSTNLANIEKGSLIQGQEKGADMINSKATAVAMASVADLLKSGKGVNLSSADSQKLQDVISKALSTGRANTTATGRASTVFSETADPIHVIADSLAKVGGGGRYVRTGLSIAEKAAIDSARFNKQQADLQMKYLPMLGNLKTSGAPNLTPGF